MGASTLSRCKYDEVCACMRESMKASANADVNFRVISGGDM